MVNKKNNLIVDLEKFKQKNKEIFKTVQGFNFTLMDKFKNNKQEIQVIRNAKTSKTRKRRRKFIGGDVRRTSILDN